MQKNVAYFDRSVNKRPMVSGEDFNHTLGRTDADN